VIEDLLCCDNFVVSLHIVTEGEWRIVLRATAQCKWSLVSEVSNYSKARLLSDSPGRRELKGIMRISGSGSGRTR